MKILGFEISVRRVNSSGEQLPAIMPEKGRAKHMFFRRSGKGYSRIILPVFDTSDPFLCGRMQHLAEKLQKMFTAGWLDISVVRDIVGELNLCQTSQTMECLDQLALLHCVNFKHIEPGLVERIPFMINHIFSEGQLPAHNVPNYEELVANNLA